MSKDDFWVHKKTAAWFKRGYNLATTNGNYNITESRANYLVKELHGMKTLARKVKFTDRETGKTFYNVVYKNKF